MADSRINAVVELSIGKAMPGAPHINAVLAFQEGTDNVFGFADLTQAVNPPLNAENLLYGTCHCTGLGKTEMLIALTGTALPQLLGAPHITQMMVVVEGMWGTGGHASYRYITGGGQTIHTVKEAPFSAIWLKKP